MFAFSFRIRSIKICSRDPTACWMEPPMLSSTMVRAPDRLMAMILVAQMSLASRADGASEADRPSRREPPISASV